MSALRIKLLRPVYYLGLFLVMAPLLVYFFSQNPPGAGAISTIATTDYGLATDGVFQRKVVQSSNGTIVAFYATTSGSPTGIVYQTSTDNAGTWSSAIQVDPVQNRDFSIAIDSSNHIYVAFSSGVSSISAVKLTYSAGSWTVGSPSLVTAVTSCAPGENSGSDLASPTITVDSTNKVWINSLEIVRSHMPDCEAISAVNVLTFSSSDFTAWTPNASSIAVTEQAAAPLNLVGTELWMVVPGTSSNSGIWRDATASGTWTKITANTTIGLTVSLTSGSSDQLDLFYENGSNSLVYRKYTISTTTLGSETTISSTANDELGTISSDGTTLYAFYQSYVAVNSYNIVYKKFNGSEWDSSPTSITTDNAHNRAINSVAKRVGANYIPLIWIVAGTPNTVKGHAVSTSAGSAPSAPTLIYPSNSETGVVHRPHFELRATDADGNYLKYKIEVCSTSNCSVVVRTIDQTSSQTGWAGQDQQTGSAYSGSTTLTSSTIAQHNYQNPPLAVSTQYWWRAYAIDPGGGNTFSSPSSIFTFTTAAAIPIQFQPNTTIRGGTKIN